MAILFLVHKIISSTTSQGQRELSKNSRIKPRIATRAGFGENFRGDTLENIFRRNNHIDIPH